MEAWQRERIRTNLDLLVDLTQLSSNLFMILQANGILTQWYIWELDADRNQGTKAIKFYTIIQEKRNAYERLIDAFQNCNQTGAFEILAKAKKSEEETERTLAIVEKPQTEMPTNTGENVQQTIGKLKPSIGMEKWQCEHIRKNLDVLVDITHVSSTFLTSLKSKRVLSQADICDLWFPISKEAERDIRGPTAQCLKFYMIIQTKGGNVFEKLITTLQEYEQCKAANILGDTRPLMRYSSIVVGPRNDVDARLNTNKQIISKPVEVNQQGMEAWQREHIRLNLERLLYSTHLSPAIIARLYSKLLLNRKDMWVLDAELNEGKRILKFYDIIQTKGGNAFNQLIQIFDDVYMTGASSILKSGVMP